MSDTNNSCSDDVVIGRNKRRRRKPDKANSCFRIALRLYSKTEADECAVIGPCRSHGIMFLNDKISSAATCFTKLGECTGLKITYIEFHPPEDMSIKAKIRIDQGSEEADDEWESVVAIFRAARKFSGEPSYRTIETEIGVVARSGTI